MAIKHNILRRSHNLDDSEISLVVEISCVNQYRFLGTRAGNADSTLSQLVALQLHNPLHCDLITNVHQIIALLHKFFHPI